MTDKGSAQGMPKKHAAPVSNRDTDFFYEGLEAKQILIQKCGQCGRLRNPPTPMCPSCNALSWSTQPMSGKGRLYSYIVHHHPPLPGFAAPHPVGVVDLEEGLRFVAGLDGIPLDELQIGMPLEAEFIRRGDLATVRFRKAQKK